MIGGPSSDHIYVAKIDLRDKLEPSQDSPEGINLWMLVQSIVIHASTKAPHAFSCESQD